MRSFLVTGSLCFCALLPTQALAASVYAQSAMVKVRPTAPATGEASTSFMAARNEFVSFQVVVHGGVGGAKGISAKAQPMVGAGVIDASQTTLYREAYLQISRLSGGVGQKGAWPDGLIPDVDEVVGEKRNAFPFDVPANEARALWVDVHVPEGAAPGAYQGAIVVSGAGVHVTIPVSLNVVDATLPSTSSLASAFLLHVPSVCRTHAGQETCGGPAAQAALASRYQKLALDHRFTLSNFFTDPAGGDWAAFDAAYGPYLEGRAPTRLKGARMTSAQFTGTRDAARLRAFTEHFRAKGWLDRAFDYTGDEPPYGISFAEAVRRAKEVRTAAPGLRTLLTTTIDAAKQNGLEGLIDILVPVVNHLEGTVAPYVGDQRAKYDGYLANPQKDFWIYQSCMSQGCAYGTNTPENTSNGGWPSYMVDRSAARNRAMQWLAFKQRAAGELYYETALALSTAWTDQFRFNGNGDGTLFYPGTPKLIGGTTDVPVPSIRMKQIRLGMQDYEWLKLVAAQDPGFADTAARTVIPAASRVTDDGAALERVRLQLISRYLDLGQKPVPPAMEELPPILPAPVTAADGGVLPQTPSGESRALPTGLDPEAVNGGCASSPGAVAPLAGLAVVALMLASRRRVSVARARARRR